MIEKIILADGGDQLSAEIENLISECDQVIYFIERRLSNLFSEETFPERMPMTLEKEARRLIDELKAEMGPAFRKDRAITFLKAKKKAITDRLSAFYRSALSRDQRQLAHGIRGIEAMEKELKRVDWEISVSESDAKTPANDNRITNGMIARAKEHPFENLIQVGRGGMVRCVFHADKTPSMYIKNGFAFCFGCSRSWDTIAFVQERDGLSFAEAVRHLQ